MKKINAILLSILFIISSPNHIFAKYDPTTVPNNKVGIHILETSEVEAAARLVNNNGGDWGYVTVPIQPTDRNKDKWQKFMDDCARLHLIPIVRITTIPLGGTWVQGEATDLVDFANFLTRLKWPVENRYIVLFNEVNRSSEWGGTVDPVAYAKLLRAASSVFHERSSDFFLLGPSLDDALPNSSSSMSSSKYLSVMQAYDPSIWNSIDGWAAHSYPNPGFAARPTKTGWQSIVSYKTGESFVRATNLPVFVTETGWDQNSLSSSTLNSYWTIAWSIWNNDKKVVAVTPFILQGGAQFNHLSFIKEDGRETTSYLVTSSLGKVAGAPPLGSMNNSLVSGTSDHEVAETGESFHPAGFFLSFENILRQLFGLPSRGYVELNGESISVDLALTPGQWEKGLSGRANLDEGSGMLFIFPMVHVPAFWMKDMNFDLDIIWLRDNKVISISKDVKKPENNNLPTYSPTEGVNQVLEVPSGYSDRHHIKIGDTLTIIK